MNSNKEAQDVQFMLRRCIHIALTDNKDPTPQARSFGFTLNAQNSSIIRTFYPPLAMLVNAAHILPVFSNDVCRYVRNLTRHFAQTPDAPEAESRSSLDDILRTIPSGEAGLPRRRIFPRSDALMCVLVGEEFLQHCETLIDLFANESPQIRNTTLLQIVGAFEESTKKARNSWDLLVTEARLPIAEVKTLVLESSAQMRVELCQLGAKDIDDVLDGVRRGSQSLHTYFYALLREIRLSGRLARWRNRWLNSATGFKPGNAIRFVQTRGTAGLFQLWCFSELAQCLAFHGYQDWIQCSMLQKKGQPPTFQTKRKTGQPASKFDAYFDFRGFSSESETQQRFFVRGAHVEWFIKNRARPKESIIVDTKYKDAKAVDFKSTLGYLPIFQNQRAIVIFRDEIPPDSLNAVEMSERYFKCESPGHIKLWALQLIPRASETQNNDRTLRHLVKSAFACK